MSEEGAVQSFGKQTDQIALQWSLARMSEEGRAAVDAHHGAGGASMEPRSNERGRSEVVAVPPNCTACFNGASLE